MDDETAPYQDVLYKLEVHYTKVHGPYFMVKVHLKKDELCKVHSGTTPHQGELCNVHSQIATYEGVVCKVKLNISISMVHSACWKCTPRSYTTHSENLMY